MKMILATTLAAVTMTGQAFAIDKLQCGGTEPFGTWLFRSSK